MYYAYMRVSTDKQHADNQRFEILKFADEKNFKIGKWVEETASGTKAYKDRALGGLIDELKKDDVLILTEISRLGRSLMEVMSILHLLMERHVNVFTTKERYELGDNLNSKILAFAFSLAAEIERQMISQRTKEALAKRKSDGQILGRPVGRISTTTKLSGKESQIKELIKFKVSKNAIARILNVHPSTVARYIKNHDLS